MEVAAWPVRYNNKESEREREKLYLKYIIKNSQNKEFSAMNTGGGGGRVFPPPHIFEWGPPPQPPGSYAYGITGSTWLYGLAIFQ